MGPGEGPQIINYGAVSMGYGYVSSAVGDADPGPTPFLPRELADQPGSNSPESSRAAHLYTVGGHPATAS